MRTRSWFALTVLLAASACARPLPVSMPGTLTAILARGPVQLGRGNWLPDTPMLTPRYHMAAGVIDGRLITAGGISQRLHGETEVYDSRQGGWRAQAPMPTPRYLAASGVIADKLYVAGGWNNGALTSLEAYDASRNRWETLAPLPEAVLGASGIVLAGELHVLGGVRNRNLVDSHFIYNPKGRRWRREPALPFKRAAMTAFAMDDRIYCWGGWSNEADGAAAGGSCYDGASGRWTALPPMPEGRVLAAVATTTDRAYVLGGADASGWLTASTLVYDAPSRQWSQGPDMATARNGSAAGIVGNRLIVAGEGIGDDAPSVEQLDVGRNLTKGLTLKAGPRQMVSKYNYLVL